MLGGLLPASRDEHPRDPHCGRPGDHNRGHRQPFRPSRGTPTPGGGPVPDRGRLACTRPRPRRPLGRVDVTSVIGPTGRRVPRDLCENRLAIEGPAETVTGAGAEAQHARAMQEAAIPKVACAWFRRGAIRGRHEPFAESLPPPFQREMASALRQCHCRSAQGCRTRGASAASAARCAERAAPRGPCPGRGTDDGHGERRRRRRIARVTARWR